MKSLLTTLLVLPILLPCFGQVQQINDCADAQVICSDAAFAFNPDGPGYNDFENPNNLPGCIVALEQNSAWYYFEIDPNAPPDLVLGFIIHPLGGYGEDYDWALYGPDVNCNDLGAPIRCSSSSFMCGFCPETGMGMGATDVTEGPGTGDGFVMTLVVQPGQGYYLLIDNWLGTDNGFTMEWTDPAAPWLNCAAEPPCALNADAGNDLTVCEGDELTLIGGGTAETYTWTGTNGGTTFLDDPEISSPTVSLPPGFSGTITYTLVITEDTCVAEDDMVLTVLAAPIVTINPAGPFCPTDAPVFLTATPPGGTWSGAVTNNSFNPALLGTGIHTVIYTFSNPICTVISSMDIEVYESPAVEIDPDPAEFCDNENGILLTANGSDGAGGYTYQWTTPSEMADGSTYLATQAGPHMVTVTDANGCTDTTTTIVITHANPEVEIIDPGPICASTEFFTLTASPSGGEFFGNIISPDGDMNPNMIPPGTYSIDYSYFDEFNCEGTDNATITIIPVPEVIAGNNGPLCGGQTILLTGETNDTGAVITYLWTGPNGYMSTEQNPTDATEGGNYILQVTVDGCPSLPTVTTVILQGQPDVSASNDGPYCGSASIQLLGSTSATGNTISFAWTGPNGYTSDQQNPTDASEAGAYTLVITVDGCSSVIDTTEVLFSQAPDAAASNSGPYCEGASIALFGTTSATGNVITYAWTGPGGYQSTAQNPTDATAAGVYQLIIDVDGCSSLITTTDVVINATPTPVITGQPDFCTGFSATLDAGAGYAAYLWSNGGQGQLLEVFTSGTYQVTVTTAPGCTGVDTFAVTENSSLSPNITGTLDFCEGSSTVLDAGMGYVSYTWSTGETSQTIQVTNGGNIGVIVTDSDGCTGSTIVTATEHQNPAVTIGGSTTYCIGGFTVLDAGAGYASYVWNTTSTSQTITVTTPGVYAVDVIDIFGCPGSASVTVDESTSLSPVITGLPAFCENGTTTLNAGSGFATYVWSDGSMNQMLVVNTAGIYSVTVSDGQSCTGESAVAVVEVLPPVANVRPSTSLCNTLAGGSLINLYDLILSGDTGGSWEDADNSGAVGLFTNLNFNGIAAGDYRFFYTTDSAIDPCPETVYEVVVTVIDCACPDVFFFSAGPLCNSGDVLNLTDIENTTEPGTWSLIQVPPGSNPAVLNGTSFNAASGDPGTYILRYSLQNQPPPGCPVDFQVAVNVDQEVDAGIAAQPAAYCFDDDELVNLSGLLTGADPNGTWSETSVVPSQGSSFNAINGSFSTTNQLPGAYTFEYALPVNGACPADEVEVSVVINPLPVVTVVDQVIIDCNTPTQSLDADGSSEGPGFAVSWTGPGILPDGNENTLHPTIDKPGNYVLTITNTITGCINTASVNVNANTDPPSTALISSQDPRCFGEQNAFIQIDQVVGGVPPYAFSLNNEPPGSNGVYPDLSAGTYTLTVEDVNGCRWDTLITLTEPAAFAIDLGADIEIGLGESATVLVTVNPPSTPIDTLIWAPDDVIDCIDLACLEANLLPYNSVALSATLIDQHGCAATDEVFLLVDKTRHIYIPTAFSPNNDGANDIFYILGDAGQITNIKKFAIYSRWGETLFEALNFLPNDPSKGWDGIFKNEKVNPGVFVYVAEVEYVDGVVQVYTGDITVVK